MALQRFLGLAVCAMIALLALAASPALAETRVALVIANGAYAELPLANPPVDAGLVVPQLEAMGFEVETVIDADIDSMVVALDSFYERANEADMALFYFSGHGFALSDGTGGGLDIHNYLMATSARLAGPSESLLRRHGVVLEEVVSRLSDLAGVSLVFVDACRNDPRLKSGSGAGRGFSAAAMDTFGDVFVGLSTRLGDVAYDGKPGQGSPFARAFVEHMPRPGLSVDRAFNEVRKAVQAETGTQRPEPSRNDLKDPDEVVLVAKLPDPVLITDERMLREREAAAAWAIIEGTEDRVLLETDLLNRFIEKFSDTSFGPKAEVKQLELYERELANLEKLKAEDERRAAAATEERAALLAEEAWRSLTGTGDIGLLQAFIEAHPASPHANEARQQIAFLEADAFAANMAEQAWAAIKDSGDIRLLQAFIETNPNSPRIGEARAKVAALQGGPGQEQQLSAHELRAEAAWNQLENSTDIARLNDFIEDFGDTSFGELARQRKADISGTRTAEIPDRFAEEAAWKAVLGSESIAALEAFIATYPQSYYIGEARARIAVLQRDAPLAADWPRNAEAGDILRQLREKPGALDLLKANSSALGLDVRKRLQSLLKRDGYYAGALDGAFGPQTYAALAAYQSGGFQ